MGIWWRDRTPEMIHRKGNRIRRDLGFVGSEPVEPAHDVDPSAWWSQRAKEADYRLASIGIAGVEQNFDRRTITEPDGSVRYEIVPGRPVASGLDAEQWVPSFRTGTPDYAGRPPLGIPSERMEAIVETDPGDGPEGTVLLRVVTTGRRVSSMNPDANKRRAMPGGWKFWIDPAREYLVMRCDMQGSSEMVEAVAQSPKGHWFRLESAENHQIRQSRTRLRTSTLSLMWKFQTCCLISKSHYPLTSCFEGIRHR